MMNSYKNTHKFDIIGIDMSCIKNIGVIFFAIPGIAYGITYSVNS